MAVAISGLCVVKAQSNLGVGTPTPDASAKLEVSSTTQGMLMPRMTASQRGFITTPATGLLVYQTDARVGFWYYDGAAWLHLEVNSPFFKVSQDNSNHIIYNDMINYGKNFLVNADSVNYNGVPQAKMMFVPGKFAFRAGKISGNFWNNDSLGLESASFGHNSLALGGSSMAAGYLNQARSNASIALGQENIASGFAAVALGYNNSATNTGSTALGYQTKATGVVATSAGYLSNATGNFATAMGQSSVASGSVSFAAGFADSATGTYAVALGGQTKAIGFGATSMGQSTVASGPNSLAVGFQDSATGRYAVALGGQTKAMGFGATSMGEFTVASGSYSLAVGLADSATKIGSVALGYQTKAIGDFATSMGRSTTASGYAALAIGELSTASGSGAFAMGLGSNASGITGVAMGYQASASGQSSVALGELSFASGRYATAMGAGTRASGTYATAIGGNTLAKSFSETVIGYNNDTLTAVSAFSPANDSNRVFTVGNGSISTRSTAFVIQQNGNVGINQRKPTEKLDIAGSIKIVDGTQGAGKVLTSDAAGKASWGAPQTGLTGDTGPQGPAGPAGPGVPTGGTANQVLAKVDGTNFNTQWVTPSGGGATTVLRANKIGGTSQSVPLAGSTTPTIMAFETAVVSPPTGFGNYSPSTGVYTAATAGMYFVTVNLLGPDNTPASNTVGYYVNVIINNASYTSAGSNVIYGAYPANSEVLPVGLKAKGTFASLVFLNANDNIRIGVVGGNSSVPATNPNTDASCNITIVKMN